jgi:hypothetical protein
LIPQDARPNAATATRVKRRMAVKFMTKSS